MLIKVRFEVLTVVTMLIAMLWDVTPCSLVHVYWVSQKHLVHVYQTKWHYM